MGSFLGLVKIRIGGNSQMKFLWNWLKSFFTESCKSDPWDIFQPADRRIYSYFDGTEVRRTDPQVLWGRIMDKGPDLFIPLKVADSISKDAPKARQDVLRIIREIFEVEQLGKKSGGLTEDETTDLLDHFVDYIDGVKKNLKPRSISSKATSGDGPTSESGNQPTSNGSGSGSTENGNSTGSLTPSPSESVLPSA